MITVMLCDDDPIVRSALAAYLSREDDLELVASVGTADEALQVLAADPPELVLMDLALPGMDGIDATRLVRERHPGTTVVMLTTFATDEQLRRALGAGAAGFLLKSSSPEALAAAIRAARSEAGTVITPELAARLAASPGAYRPRGVRTAPSAEDLIAELCLTAREMQVLTLLCGAESNAGIARDLSLSESTVKSHISSLMAKLDCGSRLQVALTAFERGLVEPPQPSA